MLHARNGSYHADEVDDSRSSCTKFMTDFESTSDLFVTWDGTKAFILEGNFLANNVTRDKDVLIVTL